MIKLHIDIDQDGEIIDTAYSTKRFTVDRDYEFTFEFEDDEIAKNIFDYRVVDGQLVKKSNVFEGEIVEEEEPLGIEGEEEILEAEWEEVKEELPEAE